MSCNISESYFMMWLCLQKVVTPVLQLDVLSLFMSGAEKGYPDIISKLLECGVDVDMVDKVCWYL